MLSQGYGQYIFIGNVSVEEGKCPISVHLRLCLGFIHPGLCLDFSSYAGLHDLLAPDLTIANEW